MGVDIKLSANTKVSPLYANGAVLANVVTGTIHLANLSSTFSTTLSANTKVSPLYANGAVLANVVAGTIHLANLSSTISLTMPTKVARLVNDLADVNTSGVANGHVIKYISANDTFVTSDRTSANGGSF